SRLGQPLGLPSRVTQPQLCDAGKTLDLNESDSVKHPGFLSQPQVNCFCSAFSLSLFYFILMRTKPGLFFPDALLSGLHTSRSCLQRVPFRPFCYRTALGRLPWLCLSMSEISVDPGKQAGFFHSAWDLTRT
uniref:Uncharacterized protein n=1 Tax=Falco tinnunculus TaxID=100819 RepID=A0A8C4XIQ4_FALTI